MVRIAQFSADAFIGAAIALVAEDGPTAASIPAIARRVGAPTGSLYHRFPSKAAVLAAAWAEVHGDFTRAMVPPLAEGRAGAAALTLVQWARAKPRLARFLLLNDFALLVDGAPVPDEWRAAIARQEEALDTAFRALLGGEVPAAAAARLRFLVFDAPIAALRPHLLAQGPVPEFVDDLVAGLHDARPQLGQVA
ncbi:TetR/AcrR family transcriptional regulator [Zavarzinia compransoris]|uniref:TetR/AcrR family transcriptional regulator n=1 Tax=Zavarzinia compransoris TaxID=1264899 RepID=A0A317E3U0_9PROT|nr:TetR/AcrR family transcriptional regulator [Zavarzinia compransoris]PWR20073.1 TetR/AcrR family transcriptional regulator [Zavarzinia compransoris]TDP44804.1 TetR family transcriptional regulator [Zavarzinia compransoris]